MKAAVYLSFDPEAILVEGADLPVGEQLELPCIDPLRTLREKAELNHL